MNRGYTTMEEIWKDIEGYEGYYQVSNLGKVRSIDRYVKHSLGHVRLAKGKQLSVSNHGDYDTVVLYREGYKPKGFNVHRLVAVAFIPNPENKPEVNHKDGDKSNNIVSNLEWSTYSENTRHAIKHHLFVPKVSNLRTSEAIEKRTLKILCKETNEVYLGYSAASLATGVSSESISKSIQLGVSVRGYTFKTTPDSKPHKKVRNGRKVRCDETGEVFNSMTEAANRYNTCRDAISYRLLNSKPLIYKGELYHFKYEEN